MKKRDVLLLMGALAGLYFILSFTLVFEIEQIGTREQVRLRLARKLKEESDQSQAAWFYDFFRPHCRCQGTKIRHSSKAQQSAHALAVHASFDRDICYLPEEITKQQNVNIQVDDLLLEARLSYPQYLYHHTGWIQQMDVSYSPGQWQDDPLTVYFILHSHNDPGWLYTYTTYYNMWTSLTLNKAVDWLERDPTLKFVWAEVIYLKKWYEEASPARKRNLLKLLQNGQFEVVTGGLVMSDEATSHYHAMLDQLIEGHQWLAKTFNVYPKHGWAIDPFGHSPTMSYLLKRSGLESMVIQRIHYALKQHLAYRKELEFIWKQQWDTGESDTGILCHTMPFLYYNILYSCGPDIQVCCQLDFHSSKCWAWGKYQKPEKITDGNVKVRAEALLDQLRKKAQFYKQNVLLVPHGDDFRYSSDEEWKSQTENLKQLFLYMNSREDMRIKISFGTLSDYFTSLQEKTSKLAAGSSPAFPSLSGDFFTYTDRDDQYWSGYFTSRPYLKILIRKLQSSLRSCEVLYSLAQAYAYGHNRRIAADHVKPLYAYLAEVRQTLALLQHHDAITGTSRKDVVKDYLQRVNTNLATAESISSRTMSVLLQLNMNADVRYESFKSSVLAPLKRPLPLPRYKPRENPKTQRLTLAVYNSLAIQRDDIVHVQVPHIYVIVTNAKGERVDCQINPVFTHETAISSTEFQLSFEVSLPPLGIVQYHIKPVDYNVQGCAPANITIFNGKPSPQGRAIFQLRHHSTLDRIQTIDNPILLATICACSGMLKSVTTKIDGIEHQSEMRIVTYGTGSWKNPYKDKSGAYIFMPDGPAQELKYDDPLVIITRGHLLSSIETRVPLMSQRISLYNISGPMAAVLHIENKVNITGEKNLEIATRLLTDVNNLDASFYTDLNGFQMSERMTQARLPIQGNVYPVTSATFIQDSLFRATILTAQSHGMSSLHPGWIELILDRALDQDDWRGLSEGIQDNVPVTSHFQLIWESRKPAVYKKPQQESDSPPPSMQFLSLLSHLSSQLLNNPPLTFSLQPQFAESISLAPFEPLNAQLDCDMYIVNLRSLGTSDPDARALLILHRLVSDCDFPESYQACDASGGKVKWSTLFSQLKISQVEETSLTGTKVTRSIHHSYLIVKPMEIATFKITIAG